MVCENYWLVQTEDFAKASELFGADYSYFSGFSSSWLEHSQRYVADMVSRFNLMSASHFVEIAANDGYLMQYFKAFKYLVLAWDLLIEPLLQRGRRIPGCTGIQDQDH